jgi:hypothetical protein
MTLPRTRPPLPARSTDVELGPDLDVVLRSFADAVGGPLLRAVSVARVATVLIGLAREPEPVVRSLLIGLETFRRAQSDGRLSPVLARGWQEPGSADGALNAFADACAGADGAASAGLCFGPKLWFTMNGVHVTWRPLGTSVTGPGVLRALPSARRAVPKAGERSAAARAALRRNGLSAPEIDRLRLGDLGRLVPGAVFVPDLLADPLAVRVAPDGGGRALLLFLPHADRIAVVAAAIARYGTGAGCRQGHEPLLP